MPKPKLIPYRNRERETRAERLRAERSERETRAERYRVDIALLRTAGNLYSKQMENPEVTPRLAVELALELWERVQELDDWRKRLLIRKPKPAKLPDPSA